MPSRRDVDEEFTAFVAEGSTRLLRYCHLLTGSPVDADDLLQSSLLKVYLAWGRIESPEARMRYAKQVITREHISGWRKVGRQERPSEFVDSSVDAVDADGLGERDRMWRALQQLGERQRTVLVLRFYEDLDEKAIAELMGTSLGTVKSQLSRGLANLRPVLDERRTTTTLDGALS